MSAIDLAEIDHAFVRLAEAFESEAELREELRASREQFHRGGTGRAGAEDGELARRRHLEWFALERESPALGCAPIERALVPPGLGLDPRIARALHGSLASVFEVRRLLPGGGLALRDLVGFGEYSALDPAAEGRPDPGDVLVGRLFPLGGEVHGLSRAAVLWRSPTLLAALKRDAERAREGRRGTPRLSQVEIEAMFFSQPATPAGADPVGEAKAALAGAGLPQPEIEGILAHLARSPLDPRTVLPGASDGLADVLDRLAFESDVDLDRARAVLISAWAALQAPRGAVAPARATRADVDPDRVARAVAGFDRRRSQGAPLDLAFRELERELDLGDDPDDADEDSPAPDFPGVVGALVEEFLWDCLRQGRAEEAPLQGLRSLSRFGSAIGAIEDLGPREIEDYACRWLTEERILSTPQAARDLVAALERFCSWAEDEHQLPLRTGLSESWPVLRADLPRIAEANASLPARPAPKGSSIFTCLGTPEGDSVIVRDGDGRVRSAALEPRIGSHLRTGDQIRGRLGEDGALEIALCYPARADLQRAS